MKRNRIFRQIIGILCVFSQLLCLLSLSSCGSGKSRETVFMLKPGDNVTVCCENDALSAPCLTLVNYLSSTLTAKVETANEFDHTAQGAKYIRFIAPDDSKYDTLPKAIRECDGYIGYQDDTLLLCASCEEGGQMIVDRLIDSLNCQEGLVIPRNEWLVEQYSYAFRTMTINGADIADFRIVTLSGALPRQAAGSLQAGIRMLYGITLPVITEIPKDLSRSFVIGADMLDYGSGCGAYKIEGTTVTVDGKTDKLTTSVSYMLHDICGFSETPDPQNADWQIQKEGTFPINSSLIENLPTHRLYVSAEGNDNDSGAKGSPLATIDGAYRRALRLQKVSPAPIAFTVDADCSPANGVNTVSGQINMTDAKKEAVKTNLPGIICWGDSLTYGTVSTYRKSLSDALSANVAEGIEVLNRGCGGESSLEITARSGAVPYETARDVTLPLGKSSFYLGGSLSIGGTLVRPFRQYCGSYLYGKNTVSCSIAARIGEMSGLLYYEDGGYYFKPKPKPESEITIPEGAEIYAVEQNEYEDNYLPIVFMGANGGYNGSPDVLIEQIHAILSRYRKADGDNGRFLVISAHTGSRLDNALLEDALKDEFGDHYLNLREQLSVYGPIDLGLTLTGEQLSSMEDGIVIPELLSDNIHFSAEVYGWVGKLIYNKLSSLGYFSEITSIPQ